MEIKLLPIELNKSKKVDPVDGEMFIGLRAALKYGFVSQELHDECVARVAADESHVCTSFQIRGFFYVPSFESRNCVI